MKVIYAFFNLKEIPFTVRMVIYIYVFIALCAPMIANQEPLLMKMNGKWVSPAFQSSPYISIRSEGEFKSVRLKEIDWVSLPADIKIFAPITYDPATSDMYNFNYVSPFEKQWRKAESADAQLEPLPLRHRHWLGTTKSGADVLAGLIYGTRLSLFIGLMTMLIAGITGIVLGSIAGYFGDRGMRLENWRIILSLLILLPTAYFIFQFPHASSSETHGINENSPAYFLPLKVVLFGSILSIPLFLKIPGLNFSYFKKSSFIPLDSFFLRFMELFHSVPRFILIICLAAISRPSVLSLVLILGFTSWAGIARIVRAEFLSLRSMPFIEATSALGFSPARKVIYHFTPNVAIALKVGIIFGIAGAILTEAGLSFLGIGLSPVTVTWGSLMALGREEFSAWWLVVFPGIAVSLLLWALNRMADSENRLQSEKIGINA